MADPTCEEVERVVAGLTQQQRVAVLSFPSPNWGRLATEEEIRAEFPSGLLTVRRNDEGNALRKFRLSDLGRAVFAQIKKEAGE